MATKKASSTTAKATASEGQKATMEVSVCLFCSKNLPSTKVADHYYAYHRDMCFACGLCPTQVSSTFGQISEARTHVEEEHSIAKEIVDQLIKVPSAAKLKIYSCKACPASSTRYAFSCFSLFLMYVFFICIDREKYLFSEAGWVAQVSDFISARAVMHSVLETCRLFYLCEIRDHIFRV